MRNRCAIIIGVGLLAHPAFAQSVATDLAAPHPPGTDLFGIILSAHWVVQVVMAILALAAFVALTIMVQKIAELTLAFRALRRSAQKLTAASDLPSAVRSMATQRDPASMMARVAHDELSALSEFPTEPAYAHAAQQRTRIAMDRIEAGALARLRAGSGFLASIGATSPFIGLFGTVFGIMNAFLAIAETKTTSLAVVAPGIAEALFATAIGLLAAIPAVLIYNALSRQISAFRRRLSDASAQIERLLSRDLDRRSAARFTPSAG
ncbi:MAG: tonB-system energizer ExbB [Cypionkella sp.]|nr:tonB-system energizer ExbB [Cypionkella sp.]